MNIKTAFLLATLIVASSVDMHRGQPLLTEQFKTIVAGAIICADQDSNAFQQVLVVAKLMDRGEWG